MARPMSVTITVSTPPVGKTPSTSPTTTPPPLQSQGSKTYLLPHAGGQGGPTFPVMPASANLQFSASPDYFRPIHRRLSQAADPSHVPVHARTPTMKGLLKPIARLPPLTLSWSEADSSEVDSPKPKKKPITGLETEYEILTSQLGFGATAKVMLGKSKKTGELVAIKRIPKRFILDEEFKKISNEIRILRMLHHPNLIGYYDALITDEVLYIILEYAPGEELFEYIQRKKRLSEHEAALIVRGVASGLQYIHKEGIVHADLKPENIIVDNETGDGSDLTSIKIIDFGLSRIVPSIMLKRSESSDLSPEQPGSCIEEDDEEDDGEAGGTLPYRAPELLSGSPSSPEADIWALGVILFIMLAGYPPFMSDDHDPEELGNIPFWALYQDHNDRLREHIATADFDYFPQCWEGISSDAENLMRRLLSRSPEDRPTASQILEDKWITMVDTLPRRVARSSMEETPVLSRASSAHSDSMTRSSSSSPSVECFHIDVNTPDIVSEDEDTAFEGRSLGHELQFLDHVLRDRKKFESMSNLVNLSEVEDDDDDDKDACQ